MKYVQGWTHEKVQQNIIKLNYTSSALTFAHEFIHCFGVPDEYGKPAGNAILLNYLKPDGTFAPNLVAVSTGYSHIVIHNSELPCIGAKILFTFNDLKKAL